MNNFVKILDSDSEIFFSLQDFNKLLRDFRIWMIFNEFNSPHKIDLVPT